MFSWKNISAAHNNSTTANNGWSIANNVISTLHKRKRSATLKNAHQVIIKLLHHLQLLLRIITKPLRIIRKPQRILFKPPHIKLDIPRITKKEQCILEEVVCL